MPKSSEKFPVLAALIDAVNPGRAVEIISGWIRTGRREYVNVCTAHTTLECFRSAELARIVNGAGLAVPDGMPLVWLGKLRGRRVDRVYGPDLMLALCEAGLPHGYRHFLYGSTPAVLEQLEKNLRERYPNVILAGSYSPPFRDLSPDETKDVARMINDAKPDVVWVGLGTPKQDRWVAEFRDRLAAPVLVAIGAAFDFHAGTLKQAPRWMMRCGLEWLYRLAREPRRLWRRYILGNPAFVCLALWQLLTGLPRPGTNQTCLSGEND